jgi:hypothetical protein
MSGEVLRLIYDLMIGKTLKDHWGIGLLVILVLGALIWKIGKELGGKKRRKQGKSVMNGSLSRGKITIEVVWDSNPKGNARRRTKSTKIKVTE